MAEIDPRHSLAKADSPRSTTCSRRTSGDRTTTASPTRTAGSSTTSSTRRRDVIGVYLPPDANTLLSVADHCLRSRNFVIREARARTKAGPECGPRRGPAARHKRASGACRFLANSLVAAVVSARSRSRSQRHADHRQRDQTSAAAIAQRQASVIAPPHDCFPLAAAPSWRVQRRQPDHGRRRGRAAPIVRERQSRAPRHQSPRLPMLRGSRSDGDRRTEIPRVRTHRLAVEAGRSCSARRKQLTLERCSSSSQAGGVKSAVIRRSSAVTLQRNSSAAIPLGGCGGVLARGGSASIPRSRGWL